LFPTTTTFFICPSTGILRIRFPWIGFGFILAPIGPLSEQDLKKLEYNTD
jgi:hypothetical protein